MSRVTKSEKTDLEKTKEVEKKIVVKEKKARPNYYWVRPRVTDGDAFGLSNYGLSKWRDTVETVPCAYDQDAGKWLTGLDDNDPKILSIVDEQERNKKIAEVIELRTQLEKQTGLNLSATNNTFWESYLILLSDNRRPFIPHLNPKDRIAIEVLKRRGDIPFGSGDLFNAKYTDVKFYIETEEAEANTKTNKRKLEKEAIAASYSLEGDYDRLWKVCYLLQLTKTVNESTQSLVEKVDEYIERNKKYPDELEKLLLINELSDLELDGLTMFRKAVKAGVVRFDRETKLYYRGGFNMKGGELDSMKMMILPDNGAYYAEIIEEVHRKEGIQANLA